MPKVDQERRRMLPSRSLSLARSAASFNEEPPGLNSFAGRMHRGFVIFCEIRAESRSGKKNAGINLSLCVFSL